MLQDSDWTTLDLPTFMYLSWAGHEDLTNPDVREVIFHVPSGCMVEIFDVNPKADPIAEGKLVFRFGYVEPMGEKFSFWAVLLRCPGRDWRQEKEALIKEVVRPACQWYCEEQDYLFGVDDIDDDNDDFEEDDEDFDYL